MPKNRPVFLYWIGVTMALMSVILVVASHWARVWSFEFAGIEHGYEVSAAILTRGSLQRRRGAGTQPAPPQKRTSNDENNTRHLHQRDAIVKK